jgi:glycosyltransferase involved in cell wall biosynthesis
MTVAPREIVWPCPADTVPLRDLLRWDRAGARRLLVLEREGWRRRDLRAILLRRTARRMAALFRRFRDVTIRRDTREEEPAEWLEWLRSEPTAPRSVPLRPLCVVHYASALYPGGAERQLCNLVSGSVQRGLAVSVWTALPTIGEHGHYLPLLREAGVAVRTVRPRSLTERGRDLPWHLLRWVPDELRDQIAALSAALADDTPHVLHCWLDQPNIVGAIAGLLAGVPAIVLATRNGNPANFPRLFFPYQHPWYRVAARSTRVRFVANSRVGAQSYAEWLGMPMSRFDVIANGFAPNQFPTPTADARTAARAAFGLAPTDSVVCGVFRLADEKRPFVFLDVVRRVRSLVPNLRVLLAGDGDRAATVAEAVRSTGMSDYVRLLGRCDNVGQVLLASDLCLLTSAMEGCPNITLEAQHLGIPVVATAVGGTVDAVADGETGLLADVDDVVALTGHVLVLLTDHALRSRFAQAGPSFVAGRYGCDRMVDETLRAYGRALGEQRAAPNLPIA